MSDIKRIQKSGRQKQPDYGVFDPDTFWGRPLAGLPTIEPDLPFEERVARAWRRLKAGFQEDEYERLREVLVRMIEAEANTR